MDYRDVGISSFQDAALVPPDIDEDDKPSAESCFLRCAHSGACERVWCLDGEINKSDDGWMDCLASNLGCDECEEFDG